MNRHQRRLEKKTAGKAAPPQIADAYAQATGHHAAGRLGEAAAAYRHVLALDPTHPDTLHLLGVIAYQTGRADEAIPLMRDAVAHGRRRGVAAGPLASYLSNLGSALQQAGMADQAVVALRQSLALAPNTPGTHANLANALKDTGALEEAVQAAQAALALRPDFPNALNTLGSIELTRGHLGEAIAAFRRALELAPDSPLPLANLGAALRKAGDGAGADACLVRALTLAPDHVDALNALACLRQDQGREGEAKALFERLLSLAPDHALGHLNLAILLAGHANSATPTAQLEEAATLLRRAIALKQDLVAAHISLGAIHQRLGRHGEAIASLRAAIALDPGDAQAHNNLGTALDLTGDRAGAARHYAKAAALAPDLGDAHLNLALTALQSGDLEAGWPAYESRWSSRQLTGLWSGPTRPRWAGEDLSGKHLLVWREQGLGDELMFASLLPELKAHLDRQGARLSVAVDPRLAGLVARALPGATILPCPPNDPNPPAARAVAVDVHLPLGSLPALMRRSLGAFKAGGAYLAAKPDRVAHWRSRLNGASGTRLNIGLCWRSGLRGGHRDGGYTALTDWAALMALPGVRPVCLQYDDTQAEFEALARLGGEMPLTWPDLDLRNDQEEVAALITALDLVITAPTAVGELAGALGTPCWRLDIGDGDWSRLGTAVRPWFRSQRIIAAPSAAKAVREICRHLADLCR